MKTIARDKRTVDKVRALAAQGLLKSEISRQVRISITTINRIVELHGVEIAARYTHKPRPPKPAPPKTKKKFRRTWPIPNYRALWSIADMAWLAENYRAVSTEEAAQYLGRRARAVQNKALEMGIPIRPQRHWQYKEDEFLKANFHNMAVKDIARKLGRRYDSVYERAQRLGLGWVSDRVKSYHLTVKDVVVRFGVARTTIYSWVRSGYLTLDHIGMHGILSESEFMEWLEAGNILRTDRAVLEYRDRLMYDRVRAQFYSKAEILALDIPALTIPRIYRGQDVKHPAPLLTSQSHSVEHVYYRKTEVWAYAYRFGHLIPDTVQDADLADVRTAWLTVYVTAEELRQHIDAATQNYWTFRYQFPRYSVTRKVYNRAEVIAWLRERGKHDIAHRLTRGAVLCYDDLIRDRRSRSKATQ